MVQSIAANAPGWLYLLAGVLLGSISLWSSLVIIRRPARGSTVARRAAWWLVTVQLAFLFLSHGLLWRDFRRSDFTRWLVPPHNWFLVDQFNQDLTSLLAGWLAAGVLFLLLALLFVKVWPGKFLDPTDLMLLSLGAGVVGWPSVLLFLGLTFATTVIGLVFLVIIRRRSARDRLVITPFIPVAVILTLVFQTPLLAWTHLGAIRF
ncbi:MAG: hypothetical protein HYY50_01565 [Candidatus Kerfeldbacteria bacterium]|nr:hypothetical protein [Candidatus Kerfeldbacteria bacterium]